MSEDKEGSSEKSKGGVLTSEEQYARQFLLNQHTEMNEDWRHLNHRIETAINLYIAVWALVGSGTVALYTELKNIPIPLRLIGLIVLFALGTFTARRVTSATILRERKRLSTNLIKLFFQERTPEITDYSLVYVQTPRPLKGGSDKERRRDGRCLLKVSFPDGIVYFIYGLNSLLAGLFSLSLVLAAPIKLNDLWSAAIFALGFAAALYIQHCTYARRKSKYNLKQD